MYPPETALILVAVLNQRRDLEIARLLGWYRIPFKSAPKVIAVDYLAFYQTAVFGEPDAASICYTAAVHGHELTTRAELLREEPNHPRAREEYFKLQIGALHRLPQPIRAEKWRRITFFYTTGEHLRRAKTIGDLIVQGEDRRHLWQALSERTEKTYQVDAPPPVDLAPEIIAALLGIRDL